MIEMIVVVGLILAGVWLSRRSEAGVNISGPTLVLRRFEIDELPAAEVLVDIVGRAPGVMAWLLTTLGIDAETSLQVTEQEVSFQSASLSGQIHHVVPLPSVSSAHCGYSKSISCLTLGTVLVLGGMVLGAALGKEGGGWMALLGLLIGGAFLVAYWLSKKIIISFETHGGLFLGLAFQRSLIENVPVDMEQARRAIRIVNERVVESQTRKTKDHK
jgi:hypothetical protein